MNFEGKWNICEMDMWDKDYFNMEVQAYISIDSSGRGNFQFGLVSGDIRGKVRNINDGKTFEFRFEGMAEMDETSGEGWLKIVDENNIEGEFEFDEGDSSGFNAIRAKC